MRDVCTDAEMLALLRAAQQGEPAAFDRLYTLYADKLFRHLYIRLGAREEAEDLTAEAFVRLIHALPQYRVDCTRPVAAFSAWLYRIANNLLTDHQRRQRLRNHADIADHADFPAANPPLDRQATAAEEQQQLWDAIHKLEPDQRTVIVCRFAEECSLQEVAAIMGKSLGAVKALQHRALANLRRALTDRT